MDNRVEPSTLSSILAEQTRWLHIQAERSGFVSDMLRGEASRSGYVLYLRSLWPVYERLELALERHRGTPALRGIAVSPVYRSSALAADLARLCGDDWRARQPFLPAAQRYVDRIAAAAEGAGEALIGHAYVRYLGDLSGGQILKRLLARSLNLPADALSFYDFPEIEDIGAFKTAFREAIDRASGAIVNWKGVVEAAQDAFSINIEISEAVRRAVLEPQARD
jgi:heme oxygenase